MSVNTRLIKRLAIGLLGLLTTLTALAVPIADVLQQLPPPLTDRAPEPIPLLILAVALLAVGSSLRRRAAGTGQVER